MRHEIVELRLGFLVPEFVDDGPIGVLGVDLGARGQVRIGYWVGREAEVVCIGIS